MVIVGDDVLDQSEITVAIDQDAVPGIVAQSEAFRRESIGAVGFLQAMEPAGEGQVSNLHQVCVIEVNQRLGSVIGNGRDELGDFGRVARPGHGKAAVEAQTDIGLACSDKSVDERVNASVDVQN